MIGGSLVSRLMEKNNASRQDSSVTSSHSAMHGYSKNREARGDHLGQGHERLEIKILPKRYRRGEPTSHTAFSIASTH